MFFNAVTRLAGDALISARSGRECPSQRGDSDSEMPLGCGAREGWWVAEGPAEEAARWSLLAQAGRGGLIEPQRGLLTWA